MKGFALVLLCALVAVQARHTSLVKSTAVRAALGENPWVVHLRIAVSTSGLLETGAGTLINERWVLAAASSIVDARFIWTRYGVVNVINPSLVTENSIVTTHDGYNPQTGANNIGVININRVVQSTDNISPVALATATSGSSATLCIFGATDEGAPGESLECSVVTLEESDDGLIITDSSATEFDLGAGLVEDGVQIGLVAKAGDEESPAVALAIADYLEWIESATGLSFENGDVEGDSLVHFVN